MPSIGKLAIKSKIWIVDEGANVVFGSGRLRILDAIARHGSIHSAAPELGMSYRAVWGKIKATEARLGQKLVTTKAGGKKGGGSELTPFAMSFLERFRELQEAVNLAADNLFRDRFFLEPTAVRAATSYQE